MIITAVRYRKLVTGPRYSHQAVEAEAAVFEGDRPEDILLELSGWVRSQIEGESPVLCDLATLRNEVDSLYRTRDQLRGSITEAKGEYDRLRAEIATTKTRNVIGDDLPF
jgi:hypothetical protein